MTELPSTELPSMDEVLADSARRERRANLRLGLFLVAASAALFFGMHALTSGGTFQFYVIPGGAFAFGIGLIGRALSR